MSPHRMDVQSLLDRTAIHQVLERYFQGVDAGRLDQVRNCFTADVRADYDGRAPVRGIDALMDSFLFTKKKASGEWKVTTHFMGNVNINLLEGDVAETETNAIAFLVLAGEFADRVAMRSLRYLDRFVRRDGAWRISERQHTLDWSCELPATFAVSMAQRVTAREGHMS
jgi:SnoaL-like protein